MKFDIYIGIDPDSVKSGVGSLLFEHELHEFITNLSSNYEQRSLLQQSAHGSL